MVPSGSDAINTIKSWLRRISLNRKFLLAGFVLVLIFVGWTIVFPPECSESTLEWPLRDPRQDSISRMIHQSWKTKRLPKRFARWSASWKRCFPTWRHVVWTDSDNRGFLEQQYPWFLPTYDSLPNKIHRADAIRYFYMLHHGGVYTDLDGECVKPFEHLLVNHSIVFGTMKGYYKINITEGYIQNSFMYSEAGHPFWKEVIQEMMQRIIGQVETRTGPLLLIHVINEYRKRHPNAIKVYPYEYFNPWSWIKEGRGAVPKGCNHYVKMSDSDMEECARGLRQNSSNVYVMQYHSHTWQEIPSSKIAHPRHKSAWKPKKKPQPEASAKKLEPAASAKKQEPAADAKKQEPAARTKKV